MGNRTDSALRQQLIFFSVLLMLAALFASRVLLTIGMISFLVFTCVHRDWRSHLHQLIRNRFLIGLTVLFLLPLLSGLWSEDSSHWLRSVRIKLPLLLFPLAFAGPWQLPERKWQQIAGFFLLLLLAGCCWSLWKYASDLQAINTSYLRAKALPTPLENDHIRFSLLVCVGLITGIFLSLKETSKTMKWTLYGLCLFFAVYLHILAARTGLAGLYINLTGGLLYFLMKTKSRKISIAVLLLFLLMPLLAWWALPTFQNRIRYMLYDLQHMAKGVYLPGSNDGSRLMSLHAGWDIMEQHPFGVGSGDVVNETGKWYALHVPQMVSTGLYPSSEWLMYGAALGWPGFIIFTLIMLLPFFEKRNFRFFWYVLNAVAGFSLLFDIGLEVQFGVFIYVFTVLWWWKWLGPRG